jgi:hypothetical protein
MRITEHAYLSVMHLKLRYFTAITIKLFESG